MKKLFYLFILTGLLFTACKKDDTSEDEQQEDQYASLEPTQEQRGFAINYTAAWCSPCGNWGAPLIHDYANDAPTGAVICAHASGDPMHNQALYASFKSDRTTGGGIPAFWVGDVKTHQSSAMNYLLNQASPCGIDYKYEVKDGKMTVDVKVKFFEQAQGDYFLSVLVLEDGIQGGTSAPQDYQQHGTNDSNYTHDFVLRASSTGNIAYGESMVSDPAKDYEFTKTYTIDVDASWNDVYPVCIVWRFDGAGDAPHYKYVNSLKKK